MDPEATIRSLRAALAATPDNVPLRRHLAETLFGYGRYAEAELELRQLLRQDPRGQHDKLLLARAYRAQRKTSAAHVVLEDLISAGNPQARIERARQLLAEGDVAAAARDYRAAVADDPTVRDPELADRLDLPADPGSEPEEPTTAGGHGDARPGGAGAGRLQPIRSDVKFAQVGGMARLKEEIRKKIVLPLQRPDLYQAYGKKAGGGILMYGPPGCGKTFLAKATAGEVDARFLAVGIHEVLEMWVGQSERNMHEVFATARAHRPCVLFFDEVDALGSSRADMKHSAGRNTVNQFLAELDGVQADNDGLLVLAATNAPWHLDSAFRRPGRFDRVLFVPPPDEEARAEILRLLLLGKPQQDVDLTAIAKKTDRFSGADLHAVIDRAVEQKLDAAIATGVPEPLTTRDLLAAVRQQKATTAEWLATAKNYVLYANEAGLYDELKDYLGL